MSRRTSLPVPGWAPAAGADLTRRASVLTYAYCPAFMLIALLGTVLPLPPIPRLPGPAQQLVAFRAPLVVRRAGEQPARSATIHLGLHHSLDPRLGRAVIAALDSTMY